MRTMRENQRHMDKMNKNIKNIGLVFENNKKLLNTLAHIGQREKIPNKTHKKIFFFKEVMNNGT